MKYPGEIKKGETEKFEETGQPAASTQSCFFAWFTICNMEEGKDNKVQGPFFYGINL